MAILLNPVSVIGSVLKLVSSLQILDQFDDHMFFVLVCRSRHHSKNVSWLRKTEYISTEYNRFKQHSDKAESRYVLPLLLKTAVHFLPNCIILSHAHNYILYKGIIIRDCTRVGAFPRAFCVPNSVALASLTLQVVYWAIH